MNLWTQSTISQLTQLFNDNPESSGGQFSFTIFQNFKSKLKFQLENYLNKIAQIFDWIQFSTSKYAYNKNIQYTLVVYAIDPIYDNTSDRKWFNGNRQKLNTKWIFQWPDTGHTVLYESICSSLSWKCHSGSGNWELGTENFNNLPISFPNLILCILCNRRWSVVFRSLAFCVSGNFQGNL